MFLFARLSAAAAAVAAVLLFAPSAMAADCPYDAQGVVAGDGEALVCSCPANDSTGALYGTGRYTRDSKICTAAIHAGAVTPAGGEVSVYLGAACDDFKASSQNGVTSSAWSAYPGTYGFTWPLPACGLATTVAAPTDGTVWCPENAMNVAAGADGSFACSCAPNVSTLGAVYGSGRYTNDSNICTAALHAGAVDAAAGGAVTLYLGNGCGSFTGSTANNVTTRNWSSFPITFGFASPLPECAAEVTPPVVGSTTPTAPAPAVDAPPAQGANDGPAEWQARAELYAAALPEPLAGWEATSRNAMWENSDMTGKHVSGTRTYKEGGGMQSDIFIEISNAPDGTPHGTTQRMWEDEAYRASRSAVLGEVAGRPALIQTEGGDERIVFRMASGLFVSVGRLGSHTTTREDIDIYIAALDFAKIEALPMR